MYEYIYIYTCIDICVSMYMYAHYDIMCIHIHTIRVYIRVCEDSIVE